MQTLPGWREKKVLRASVATFACVFALGCGGGSSTPVDPVGAWKLVVTWTQSGTCGLTSSFATTEDVAQSGAGYTLSDEDGNIATGGVSCSSSSCFMNVKITQQLVLSDGTPATGTSTLDLALSSSGAINGTGNISIVATDGSGATCTQPFTATGFKD